MVKATWLPLRWKEGEGLPKQPGQSNNGAKTAAAREVECDDLVLSDAVELTVIAEAQSTRLSKRRKARSGEHAHQPPGVRIVLADSRHRIGRSERVLARHDQVAIWRQDEIERTELRVFDQPNGARGIAWKGDDRLVPVAIRSYTRGEEQLALGVEPKSPRKGYDPW